jgi:hypothetical protein
MSTYDPTQPRQDPVGLPPAPWVLCDRTSAGGLGSVLAAVSLLLLLTGTLAAPLSNGQAPTAPPPHYPKERFVSPHTRSRAQPLAAGPLRTRHERPSRARARR